jgi:peptide/nickel transport system permease protein
MDAFKPPVPWEAEGDPNYLLGTDDQGRDVLSAIMYGARVSLLVGFCAVLLSVSIGITARTVRGSTLVERNKEYVQAARVTGVAPLHIMRSHVLPNVMGPVLVLATIQVATAIITEATLSFLGVGAPPTSPSLGTLIRVGNDYLFSGEWWITIFPGAMLVLIALSVNLLGDWLRDALNPRLR